MSEGKKTDQQVALDGRTAMKQDADEQSVKVDVRERSISKLVSKLEDLGEGLRTSELWRQANQDRAVWQERQDALLMEYDEFINPIYQKSQAWSSDLHLPVAFTVGKAYHARFLQALLSIDPPFNVKARQASQEERAPLIQDLMAYTLSAWYNRYQGIDPVVDKWLWDWIFRGSGILKAAWEREYTAFVDIVQEQVPVTIMKYDAESQQDYPVQSVSLVDKEELVVRKVFDGPRARAIDLEDIVVIGGHGDPQVAEDVIECDYLTASELWSLADQGIFRPDAVKKAIASGESYISGKDGAYIKDQRSTNAGHGSIDKTYDTPRYQVFERYSKLDVTGNGIASDIIMWVHGGTGEILRATYLRRVMPTGLRPYNKIDFHRRYGQPYGVGLIELLYSITKEIDAMHNIKLDFGLISSIPFGFYRPTSSMKEERMPIEPGTLIPLDNPGRDVFFPNLNNKAAFPASEEAALMSVIERFTGMSDLSFGAMSGTQGAARTATGARALVNEANANIDVFLRRMNIGWKQFLIYTFHMLQQHVQPGFQFRLLGDDGNSYWKTIESPEELAGMYDFDIEANSSKSSPGLQQELAQQVYQLTSNPVDLQLGLVTPLERFEAIKNLLKHMGVKDFGRFVRKPTGISRVFSPIEMANRILAGEQLQITPDLDLEGFVAWVENAFATDEILGQWSEAQTMQLEAKRREAVRLIAALRQQQAQVANLQQMQTNSAAGSAPLNISGQMNTMAQAPGGESA